MGRPAKRTAVGKAKLNRQQTCVCCGKTKVTSSPIGFYSIKNKYFSEDFGLCKVCIKQHIIYEEMDTIYDMLAFLDLAFLKDVWRRAVASDANTFGKYITMIASLPQYKGKTWKDSDDLNEKESGEEAIIDVLEGFKVTQEMADRWGVKKKEEYFSLENFYHQMRDANNIETPQDEFYLKKLAMISFSLDEALTEGNQAQVKAMGDLFSKFMADSQFRAIDKTDSDKNGGIRNFSTIFAEVEKDGHIPPWEKYRKIKGLSQDIVDKTILYILNFTLRLNKAGTMVDPPDDTPELNLLEGDENV